jgi:phosphatidylglycerol:prolipoprotein diacylglycerol transferase
MHDWISYWQILPYHISPNIITIGAFQLRYYSLMYLVAFFLTYVLVAYRLKQEDSKFSLETIQEFFPWGIFGLIIGARLGYIFFYNFSYYLRRPLEIIIPFDFSHGIHFVGISGMSYHGGALGVIIASLIFCHGRKLSFWSLADLFCPTFPLGYTFGRIGNFINGELFGRVTDVPWGMFFPFAPTRELRHPSQLYEAFFEGVVLFVLLWVIRKKKFFAGFHFAVYIISYGLVRFFLEYYREPDAHLGFVWHTLSMGQLLCFAMIITGVGIMIIRKTAEKRV